MRYKQQGFSRLNMVIFMNYDLLELEIPCNYKKSYCFRLLCQCFQQLQCLKYRICHLRCFVKKTVLRNFAIFIGKNLRWSLFLNKVSVGAVCNFIKKRLQDSCFRVTIAKFVRTPILKNICKRLLLQVVLYSNYMIYAFPERFMVSRMYVIFERLFTHDV